jgi:hypothetical protein
MTPNRRAGYFRLSERRKAVAAMAEALFTLNSPPMITKDTLMGTACTSPLPPGKTTAFEKSIGQSSISNLSKSRC